MQQSLENGKTSGRRYALCVGISMYANLTNRNLRYATDDATIIAERLADPQRGNFAVTLLTQPAQTTKAALDQAVEQLLNIPDLQAEDLILLYFSCHGYVERRKNTFCLLPSDVTSQADGTFEQTMLIGVSDLARWFSQSKACNIVLLLDVCHSGGAGIALQRFNPHLEAGPNYFILGAARQNQVTDQSSRLAHGVFTYCLLRAFEQPPTRDGWLTISQIQNFISDEIVWFAKDRPIQIQISSMLVDPQLPLLRNPGYPDLCPLPPIWNVPLQRNPFFTGQDDVLFQLADMLQREQKTALTQPYALNGLGGIGKTQVALEYAYRHHQDYHAVLWGLADTRESLISTFVNIAWLLELPQKDEKDQMVIVNAVKEWLMDHSKWLFILDNADKLALVKDFLPPASRGHLLLTTRAQAMGGLAHKLEVNVMQPEVGALLLLRRSGRLTPGTSFAPDPVMELEEAKGLVHELGGLPLALDQAGAYIEETGCDLQHYQQLYQHERMKLLERRGDLAFDHPEPVATTWSISFQKIEQTNPAAAELLCFCAFLAPDAIPEELFRKSASKLGPILARLANNPLLLDEAIAVLRAYSLIIRNSQTQMLTIHRLVQAILQDRLFVRQSFFLRFFQPEHLATQQQWMQRSVNAVIAALPVDAQILTLANRPVVERLLPHALLCATWIEQVPFTTSEASYLLNQTGCYLLARAQFGKAEPLLKCALSIREHRLGAKHPHTALSLNNLAALYLTQELCGEAEPLLKRALAINERRLGAMHLQTAISLNLLALCYMIQKRYREAEPLYHRALAIRERRLGYMHQDTALSLNNLAHLYSVQERYGEAEALYHHALTIYEQRLGTMHPQIAMSLNNLAELYKNQKRYEEAETLYHRALAIHEKLSGAMHPQTALSLTNLADCYKKQARYEEAEPLYHRSLAIREQQFGATHSATVRSFNYLIEFYQSQGRSSKMASLYEHTLIIREQQLGKEHRMVETVRKDYATLLRTMGREDEAIQRDKKL